MGYKMKCHCAAYFGPVSETTLFNLGDSFMKPRPRWGGASLWEWSLVNPLGGFGTHSSVEILG